MGRSDMYCTPAISPVLLRMPTWGYRLSSLLYSNEREPMPQAEPAGLRASVLPGITGPDGMFAYALGEDVGEHEGGRWSSVVLQGTTATHVGHGRLASGGQFSLALAALRDVASVLKGARATVKTNCRDLADAFGSNGAAVRRSVVGRHEMRNLIVVFDPLADSAMIEQTGLERPFESNVLPFATPTVN